MINLWKTKKEFNSQNLAKLVHKTQSKIFSFFIKWFANPNTFLTGKGFFPCYARKFLQIDFVILIWTVEPVFLPFLNTGSVQKWKKTKIYKWEYRAGNIMQWFCRAIKVCIISSKIYAAIMVKVTFEIISNI